MGEDVEASVFTETLTSLTLQTTLLLGVGIQAVASYKLCVS